MRSELKFTNSESFRLFTSGMEALQAYEREAQLETLGKAERDLEHCERHYPQDVLPRFYLGVVRALQGGPRLDDAVRLFQGILDTPISELKSAARFNLAWTHLERYSADDLALAESELKRLLSDLVSQESSAAVVELKLQAEAMLVFLFVRQKLWFERKKRRDQGSVLAEGQRQLETLKAGIGGARLSEASKADLMAEYCNASGLLQESQAWSAPDAGAKASNAQQANQHFTQALTYKSDWLPAMQNLARVMIELQDNYDGARSILEKALRTSPNAGYTHYLLGQVCTAKGELDRAIEHYQQAAPTIESSHYWLGRLYERKGNRTAAIEHYKQVPGNQDAREALERLRSTPS